MERKTEKICGLREYKKQTTEDAIRRVALELAATVGLQKMTIEEISRHARISPRTFFNYFASKEDTIISASPILGQHIKEAIMMRPKRETPLEAVRNVIGEKIFSPVSKKGEETMRMERKVVRDNPELLSRGRHRFALFEQAIAEAVAERMGISEQKDSYPTLLAAVAMSVVRLSFRVWAKGKGTPEKNFTKYFKRLQQGL